MKTLNLFILLMIFGIVGCTRTIDQNNETENKPFDIKYEYKDEFANKSENSNELKDNKSNNYKLRWVKQSKTRIQ